MMQETTLFGSMFDDEAGRRLGKLAEGFSEPFKTLARDD
jgi:hypothetical protein